MLVRGLEPGLIFYIAVFLHFRGANHIEEVAYPLEKQQFIPKNKTKHFSFHSKL